LEKANRELEVLSGNGRFKLLRLIALRLATMPRA
jgi:hypothetical protein